MTDFFTSDTHFGHVNIRTYCHRPWGSTEEMNAGLIERWNARVGEADTVYHLGDFAMGQKHLWPAFREQLHGRIILLRGNHDAPEEMIRRALRPDDLIFNEYLYLANGGRLIHLEHVPPAYSDGRDYVRAENALLESRVPVHYKFCGHVHDAWKVQPGTGCINVGVDVRDYEPKTLEELIQ